VTPQEFAENIADLFREALQTPEVALRRKLRTEKDPYRRALAHAALEFWYSIEHLEDVDETERFNAPFNTLQDIMRELRDDD
jgi:hypothetical protein